MATNEQPKVCAEKAQKNNEKNISDNNDFKKIMDLMSGYDKLMDELKRDVSRSRYLLSTSAVKLDAARKQLASLEMELEE